MIRQDTWAMHPIKLVIHEKHLYVSVLVMLSLHTRDGVDTHSDLTFYNRMNHRTLINTRTDTNIGYPVGSVIAPL